MKRLTRAAAPLPPTQVAAFKRHSGFPVSWKVHIRAARLPAGTGDCRARFPTPESLICLAGVAPSTRKSGKTTYADFRRAAGKQLRDAVCDFAGDSRHASLRAAQLHNDAIARGNDHPHATRILARAWMYVIWHCWQNRTAYDPRPAQSSPAHPRRRKPAAA